jgi:antitoxin component YwqK of YwqJK toxin-antitoxin module
MINKLIFFFSLFTFVGLSFGQLNQKDSQGRKQGEWVKYYDNTRLVRFKGQFKNDKPVGKFIYYYPSKAVQAIIIHEDGSSRSEAYMYSESRKLIAFGIYKNEEKDSVWTHYNEKEEIIFKETYSEGLLDGTKTIYFSPRDAGTKKKPAVLKTISYKKGELHGTVVEFFPDGETKRKTNYHNGKRHGKVEHFHPGGRLFIVERWKHNKKHGWWITYEESGKELGRKYYYEGEELKGDKLEKKLKEIKAKGLNPNQ